MKITASLDSERNKREVEGRWAERQRQEEVAGGRGGRSHDYTKQPFAAWTRCAGRREARACVQPCYIHYAYYNPDRRHYPLTIRSLVPPTLLRGWTSIDTRPGTVRPPGNQIASILGNFLSSRTSCWSLLLCPRFFFSTPSHYNRLPYPLFNVDSRSNIANRLREMLFSTRSMLLQPIIAFLTLVLAALFSFFFLFFLLMHVFNFL